MRWVLPIIALFVLAAACGDDDTAPSGTPSPEPSGSATVSPTTSPTATSAAVIELTRGADIDFPNDLAFLIESGCWGCDGPPSGLRRYWKDTAGTVRSDKLLSYEANSQTLVDINGNAVSTGRIQGLTATQDASVIAFGVCIQGSCGTGGLDSFEPNSLTEVFRSMDGGITWENLGQLGPAVYVMGATTDGRVFAWNVIEELGEAQYLTMPSGTGVDPPTGGVRPVVANDDIVWATADGRLLRPDGSLFADLPFASENDPHGNPGARGTVVDQSKGSALIHWYGADMFSSRNYISPIEGTNVAQPILQVDDLLYLAAWLPKDQRAVLSIAIGGGPPVPALLDVETGEYAIIPEPFQNPASLPETGRTIVTAVQLGPFARVANTGSCLNIRAGTSSTSESLYCAADGVLLRDNGETITVDGLDWLSVTTPAGIQGWASTEFLER